MIRAPTVHHPGGRPGSSSLVAQFQATSEERAAAGGADASQGGGGVGRTQRVLGGYEASWRGHFECVRSTNSLCSS